MVTLSEHLTKSFYFQVQSTQEAEFRTTKGWQYSWRESLPYINNCVYAILSGQPKSVTIWGKVWCLNFAHKVVVPTTKLQAVVPCRGSICSVRAGLQHKHSCWREVFTLNHVYWQSQPARWWTECFQSYFWDTEFFFVSCKDQKYKDGFI